MHHETSQLEEAIFAQRTRLVGLCAHLTGDSDAAEDLTQETLLEAWRHLAALRDPTTYEAWLNGIARNVCLRWHRRQGRAPVQLDADWQQADMFDLEVELERSELATLLDRALALLPTETRQVLVQKYIEDSPHAEIATRLGLSEGAVSMRLQRGKLALQRVLSAELRDEAEAYGMTPDDHAGWQRTNIWCPHCGQLRLLLSLPTVSKTEFQLRCPNCVSQAGAYFVKTRWRTLPLFPRGNRALIASILTWSNDFYRAHLHSDSTPCATCNNHLPMRPCIAGNDTPSPGVRIVGMQHPDGYMLSWAYSTEMALYLPEGQRFWQQHRRIHALPEREVEHAGRTALLTRFERLDGMARLEVLSDLQTYEVIYVNETAAS